MEDQLSNKDAWTNLNKAVYMKAGGQGQYGSWVGAVTQICFPFRFKRPKTRSDYGPTDRRTDRPMDQPTNIVTYRVACT